MSLTTTSLAASEAKNNWANLIRCALGRPEAKNRNKMLSSLGCFPNVIMFSQCYVFEKSSFR